MWKCLWMYEWEQCRLFASHTHEQAMKRRRKKYTTKIGIIWFGRAFERGKWRKKLFHWKFHYVINAVIFINGRKIFFLEHAIQQYECECKWRSDVKFNITQTCDPFIGASNDILFLPNWWVERSVCAKVDRIRANWKRKTAHSLNEETNSSRSFNKKEEPTCFSNLFFLEYFFSNTIF